MFFFLPCVPLKIKIWPRYTIKNVYLYTPCLSTAGLDPKYKHTKDQFARKPNKGYNKSETTHEKLPASRIQSWWVYFCVVQVFTSFFKITFEITPKQTYIEQVWIRLVQYSCVEDSDLSDLPRIDWCQIDFQLFQEVKLICVRSIISCLCIPAIF